LTADSLLCLDMAITWKLNKKNRKENKNYKARLDCMKRYTNFQRGTHLDILSHSFNRWEESLKWNVWFSNQPCWQIKFKLRATTTILKQRNWVFATNSDFLITISLEPNVADLIYFKLWILLDQIIWVWNIKGLQLRVLKISRFKYLILFRRLNSFAMYLMCVSCVCKVHHSASNYFIHKIKINWKFKKNHK